MRNHRSEYVAHAELRDAATTLTPLPEISMNTYRRVQPDTEPPRFLFVALAIIDVCAVFGLLVQLAKL